MKKSINQDLKNYIESNILPEYNLNDTGHNLRHINIVKDRAFELAENYDIDANMIYVVVCFHDIACHIDREKHEMLSAERLYNDNKLKIWFNDEQILIMKCAVEDHRASLEYEPRNIYGKILSSADRKTDIVDYLKSSIGFELKRNPTASEDSLIEGSYNHAIKKFGENGYAVHKFYIEDKKYQAFLDEIQWLISNKAEFEKRALKIIEKIKKETNNG